MYSRCCLLSHTERCFGKKPCCSFFAFSGTCFRALVVLLMEKLKNKCKALFSVRGTTFLSNSYQTIVSGEYLL